MRCRRRRRKDFVLQLPGGGYQRQVPLQRAPHQHARDQQPVDLVGPLEDPVDARVAVVPLCGVVPDVAVAAVDLDVLVEDIVEDLAARYFEDGRLDGVLLQRRKLRRLMPGFVSVDLGVYQPGRPEHHRLDGEGADGHLAQLVLDRPEVGDWLAELPPLGRVAGRFPDGAARTPDRGRPELEAAVVEDVERDLVPLADLPEQVLRRHARILEDDGCGRGAVQSHLVLLGPA